MTTLEETIALLEATLEATHDGILVVDLSHRVVRCNQQFRQMFGVTAGQIAGRPLADVYLLVADQLHDIEALLIRTRELAADPSASVLDLIEFKDGRVYHRFIAPQRVNGRIVGRVASYRDMTETKRSAQALEEQRAALEEAQAVAHVGSWTWELGETKSLAWSAETCRIFGLPASSFAETFDGFMAFVHPDDRDAVRASMAPVAAGPFHGIEHRIVRGDGHVRWVHMKAHVVLGPNGERLRMVGTVQDITDRRLLEEQLRQSQKLEAIGRLAGGVAHDLNNALTAIVGYTELALVALTGDHPAFADVQEVRRGAERAESVTRQLLAFSRKQRLQPRLFNLSESIRKLGRMLERLLGAGIQLESIIEETRPPTIYGDTGQIEQALINLAVNARDAMGEDGRLTLHLRVARLDQVFARAHQPLAPGEYVELSVTDTGHGMDDETQAHIFEPFYTTKDVGKGTGLGLAMVYGTVKQSGGFIFVESEVGRGTTFRLYFPRAEAPDQPAEQLHASWLPVPFTILIADDESPVRNLVAAALSNEGYLLLHASSATEALAVAGRTLAIDLLLTDAKMPGMGGLELAAELGRVHSGIKVILMSGDTPGPVGVPGLSKPAALLPKPFTPEDLRQTVRDVLRGAGARG